MRLTLDIPDELHARLKARAKEEGTTMRALILEGVQQELKSINPGPAKRGGFPVLKSSRPDRLAIDNE